ASAAVVPKVQGSLSKVHAVAPVAFIRIFGYFLRHAVGGFEAVFVPNAGRYTGLQCVQPRPRRRIGPLFGEVDAACDQLGGTAEVTAVPRDEAFSTHQPGAQTPSFGLVSGGYCRLVPLLCLAVVVEIETRPGA